MALAAKRLAKADAEESGAASAGTLVGSRAEVGALLKQKDKKDAQMQELQRDLAEVKAELAEARARLVLLVGSFLVLGVGTGVAATASADSLSVEGWGQSLLGLTMTAGGG